MPTEETPTPTPGPIAKEVIHGLTHTDEPMKTTIQGTVTTVLDPSSPPAKVTATNIPKPGSLAWWFDKGGTTGIVCLLCIIAFSIVANSQKQAQNALFDVMKRGEDDRTKMVEMLVATQHDIVRTLDKIDARMEAADRRKEENTKQEANEAPKTQQKGDGGSSLP